MSEEIKSIGKILAAMFGTTAILLLLLAFLVKQFQWDNGTISIGIGITYIIACLLGGFFVGKVQKTKKFIWGILLGFFYVIVMLIITLSVKGSFSAGVSDFIKNLLLCLGGGMIGGMLS